MEKYALAYHLRERAFHEEEAIRIHRNYLYQQNLLHHNSPVHDRENAHLIEAEFQLLVLHAILCDDQNINKIAGVDVTLAGSRKRIFHQIDCLLECSLGTLELQLVLLADLIVHQRNDQRLTSSRGGILHINRDQSHLKRRI